MKNDEKRGRFGVQKSTENEDVGVRDVVYRKTQRIWQWIGCISLS